MPVNFQASKPIYLQLMDIVKSKMMVGEWAAGQKIPSVRDLAVTFGVNPNTIQRALSELEREKLVYSERTAGRFVTKDVSMINKLKEQTAKQYLQEFIEKMRQLGYDMPQLIELLNKTECRGDAV